MAAQAAVDSTVEVTEPDLAVEARMEAEVEAFQAPRAPAEAPVRPVPAAVVAVAPITESATRSIYPPPIDANKKAAPHLRNGLFSMS